MLNAVDPLLSAFAFLICLRQRERFSGSAQGRAVILELMLVYFGKLRVRISRAVARGAHMAQKLQPLLRASLPAQEAVCMLVMGLGSAAMR